MEEDIKILEEFLAGYKLFDTETLEEIKPTRFWEGIVYVKSNEFQAIYNLLKRYKELEEENKELELEKESYKHDYFDIYERTKRYIKEEDVIDLQEKIHKDLDKNGITRAYQIIIDKYFNKLLGEY